MALIRRNNFLFLGLLMCVGTAGMLPLGVDAAYAQGFSDGYKFLKAVKDRDGQAVTDALNEPGSVIVNTRDRSSGETAMHIVTARRDTVWIRFLAQRGANPNVADAKGTYPLMIASNLGYVEGVEALLEAGAQVNVANDTGETPLISAVHRRDVAMVQLLLKHGANPDRSDNSGRSAREYAALLIGNTLLTEAIEANDKEKAKQAPVAQSYGPSL